VCLPLDGCLLPATDHSAGIGALINSLDLPQHPGTRRRLAAGTCVDFGDAEVGQQATAAASPPDGGPLAGACGADQSVSVPSGLASA